MTDASESAASLPSGVSAAPRPTVVSVAPRPSGVPAAFHSSGVSAPRHPVCLLLPVREWRVFYSIIAVKLRFSHV